MAIVEPPGIVDICSRTRDESWPLRAPRLGHRFVSGAGSLALLPGGKLVRAPVADMGLMHRHQQARLLGWIVEELRSRRPAGIDAEGLVDGGAGHVFPVAVVLCE